MSSPPGSAKLSPFAVFRYPAFTRLWSAQFISELGSGLTLIAAGLLVYELTGSALNVGLMLMATALPSLLVGLVAGVAVDRFDRRKLMVVSDLARAMLIGLIPLLTPHNLAWLYVLVFLSSCFAQFFEPAHESLLPDIAPDEELAAANALMSVSFSGALTLGFAAAGLLAALVGLDWAFYLDALTFVVSALFIAGVRVAPAEVAPVQAADLQAADMQTADLQTTAESAVAGVFRQVREGLNLVAATPMLRSLFVLLVPIFFIFGFMNALLLPFALKGLQASTLAYGLLEGLPVFGFVVGSLLMAHHAERLHEGQWLTLSFVGMGLFSMGVATTTSVGAAIGWRVVANLCNAPALVARRLLIQRAVPRELRGRVMSAFIVTRDLVFVLGLGAVGLADFIDVRLLYAAAGAALVLVGLWALTLPGLRQPLSEWRERFGLPGSSALTSVDER